MSDSPLLSIIILTYNGKHHLPDCFQSIENQGFRDYEVILVDNNSQDGAVEYTRENYPQYTVVEAGGNFGFAEGNNKAFPYVRGRYVYFLNNDTILMENSLQFLADRILQNEALEHPQLEVLAPMMVCWEDHTLVDSGGDEIYTWGPSFKYERYSVDHPLFCEEREIASGCGGAVVYPKTLLDQIGGFDPDFFLLFEDVDLSWRARHAGAKIIFLPKPRVVHKGSATIGKISAIQMFYATRNLFWAKIKNYPLLTLLKYGPLGFITAIISLKGAIARGHLKEYLKARLVQVLQLPKFLKKRRQIQATSKIERKEFERWLRKGWVMERIRIHRGTDPHTISK